MPIIIGGVFIGRNLGRVLGTMGSKIASDFVNNLIADSVIGKYMVKPLYSMLVGNISNDATSNELTCRSDICLAGSAESKCQCVRCNGAMQYSDRAGLYSCKTCPLGQIPNKRRGIHIGCKPCSEGYIGKVDGRCHACDKAMEYGDETGATSCKTCPTGQIPLKIYGAACRERG